MLIQTISCEEVWSQISDLNKTSCFRVAFLDPYGTLKVNGGHLVKCHNMMAYQTQNCCLCPTLLNSVQSHSQFINILCTKWMALACPTKHVYFCVLAHIYTGDLHTLMFPVSMASSSGWPCWIGIRVSPPWPRTQNKMHPRSSRAVQRFARVYLHARAAVDACDIRPWHAWRAMDILTTGKPRRPSIWAPCRKQDGKGTGISRVYLW